MRISAEVITDLNFYKTPYASFSIIDNRKRLWNNEFSYSQLEAAFCHFCPPTKLWFQLLWPGKESWLWELNSLYLYSHETWYVVYTLLSNLNSSKSNCSSIAGWNSCYNMDVKYQQRCYLKSWSDHSCCLKPQISFHYQVLKRKLMKNIPIAKWNEPSLCSFWFNNHYHK